MKMKLAQRLLIGYYKTKLRTIALVSPGKAAREAFDIFCTPFSEKAPKKPPPAFHGSEKLSFEMDGATIRGFRFNPSKPNGRKILVVHGFRSYSYKFEAYFLALRQEGFEVIAFDAPAHGLSSGKRINAYIYKRVIEQIEKHYGPFYGVMGHSFGGLSASLAFEGFTDRSNRKLVLIAPAETETAIDNFFTITRLNEHVRRSFTNMVNKLSEYPISYFSVGRAVKTLDSPVLWIHDKHDVICPFADVKPLLSLDLPHVTFHVTEGLGHNKIYREEKIRRQIVQFFADGIS